MKYFYDVTEQKLKPELMTSQSLVTHCFRQYLDIRARTGDPDLSRKLSKLRPDVARCKGFDFEALRTLRSSSRSRTRHLF